MIQSIPLVLRIALVLAVLGTCVCLFLIRNKSKQSSGQKAKRCTSKEAFEAFLPYAENFAGLYEPLYKCCSKKLARERLLNTLKEWDVRMGKLSHVAPLSQWWKEFGADIETCSESQLRQRLGDLLAFVVDGGIIRDSRKSMPVDENTPLYYMTVDNDPLPQGAEITVDSPCWYMDYTPARIIEKGYCLIN